MRGLLNPSLDNLVPKVFLGAVAYGGYKALSEGSDETREMAAGGALGIAGAYFGGRALFGAARNGTLGRAAKNAAGAIGAAGRNAFSSAMAAAPGAAVKVAGAGAAAAGQAARFAGDVGLFGVNVLAGNPFGGPRKARDLKSAMKLLFPYTNEQPVPVTGKNGAVSYINPRKYALSTNIGRRVMGGFLAAGALSAVGSAMSNNAPAPTFHHDGTSLRHVNDLGADAGYARAVLGRNSNL